jgi:cell fate regulator YaaT (PSP1 superfamily)
LRRGERVIVETERDSREMATVVVPPVERTTTASLRRVLRVANADDLQRAHERQKRADEALRLARERARSRGLKIKLFRADLHGGRVVFYFACETRIDFRDLVRDLGNQLHLRVELRQVGVRDEAKLVGGTGSCGCELCCTTFLRRFETVSIKMAKHQNLVLNPSKVSGQCGRLKCCLAYEDAAYAEASKSLPRVGKRVITPDGIGRVSDLDIMTGRVRVQFPDAPPRIYLGSEVKPLQIPGGTMTPEVVDPEDPPPGVPKD